MPNRRPKKKQAIQAKKKPMNQPRSRPKRRIDVLRGRSEDLLMYVRCRLDPFDGPGGAQIPDGSNSNFISVDTKTVDTISLSGSANAFVIQTMPCLPSLAMMSANPGSTITLNGSPIGPPSSIYPQGTATTAWNPISIPGAYLTVPGGYTPGMPMDDPYHSAKARMVAVGYKLTYTGPAVTCAGSITVTPNPVSLSLATATNSGTNPTTGQTFSLSVATPSGAVAYTCGLGTQILVPDLTINPTLANRQSKTFRPEDGVVIIPRHKGTTFNLCPTRDVPCGIVPTFSNANPLPKDWYNLYNNTNSNYRGGIVWFDDDWDSYQISASGLNTDASFRWETVLCMEYNPQMSSSLTSFTHNKSPSDSKLTADVVQIEEQLSKIAIAPAVNYRGWATGNVTTIGSGSGRPPKDPR